MGRKGQKRMVISDTRAPVLVLTCQIGGLAIMRSLGSLGIQLHGVDSHKNAPAFASRYCRRKFIKPLRDDNVAEYLDFILTIGRQLGGKAVLIPTSDELAVFVAEQAASLSEYFLFPKNDPGLVTRLMNKEGMYSLAREYGVPTAATLFPRSLQDVLDHAEKVRFPVMLKGILGNRLQERTGKKMVIVRNRAALVGAYQKLEDPEKPNLMVQEYILGTDDQIFIFNGYFNEQSDCLVGFTGHKIRQYPVHVGCASLGICTWVKEVSDITTSFMKALGYRGVLDIGYRWDPRDSRYKVLDINPRVGQAFRLFVAENDMDVVRALYLDLTGQAVEPGISCEGRKWLIEDFDLESSLAYFRERSLKFGDWVRSFRGVEETAWFNWKDPVPFLYMSGEVAKKAGRGMAKRLRKARP